jgi:uncharacterized protein (DUF1697 family)/very-short-patch-repair endonuclease
MRSKRPNERWLGDVATAQHGVVTKRQLMDAGFSADAVNRRIGAGRLHPVHRGVYAVGHRVLGAQGRWLAAVLACGEGAALSHVSAAAAWGIRRTNAVLIDVTATGDKGRKVRGLRIHRNRLHLADTTLLDGIRITTPSRTLVDLAATLRTDRLLERAFDEAHILELLDHAAVAEISARTRNGRRRLRRVLATHTAGTTATASGLEEAFLALTRAANLPAPLVNHRIGRMRVDFLWPQERLVVETDGGRYHRTPTQRAADRRRDALLTKWRYHVLRIPGDEIDEDPEAVRATVHAALAARRTPSSLPLRPAAQARPVPSAPMAKQRHRQLALLRGINVGKAKQLPMAELKTLMEDLGYADVKTHLRSGNVVYTATHAPKTAQRRIEATVEATFGFHSDVLVRTQAEIDAILAHSPLREIATDGAKHLVVFLSEEPTAAARKAIEAIDIGDEEIRFNGTEAYLWCPNGVNESRAWKALARPKQGITATARNANTVEKLAELLAAASP